MLDAYAFDPKEDIVTQLLALNLDLADSQQTVRSPGGSHYEGVHLTDIRMSPPIG